MKESSNIIVQSSNNGISRIKLNEPSTYNALSLNTLKSLIKCFKSLNDDEKTKVIIIEGSGKGFSAGHNLKEINSLKGKADYQKLFNLCSELMMNIVHNSKPVIAKVHGAAFAAGCQLVATCDLALCTKDAIFATPGVNIGLFCSTPMVALSRNVNRKKTIEMLLTGEPISAKYAKEIGLVNHVFEQSALMDEAVKMAKTIAANSTLAVHMSKTAINKGRYADLDTGLGVELLAWRNCFSDPEREKRMSDFVNKSKK